MNDYDLVEKHILFYGWKTGLDNAILARLKRSGGGYFFITT